MLWHGPVSLLLAWSSPARPPLGPVRFCLFCPLFSRFQWHAECCVCVSVPRVSAVFWHDYFFYFLFFSLVGVTGSRAGPILVEGFFGRKASFSHSPVEQPWLEILEVGFSGAPLLPVTHTVPYLCPCLTLTSLLLAGMLFINFLPFFS